MNLENCDLQHSPTSDEHLMLRLYKTMYNNSSSYELIVFNTQFTILLAEGNAQFLSAGAKNDIQGLDIRKLLLKHPFAFLEQPLSSIFRNGQIDLEHESEGSYFQIHLYHHPALEPELGIILITDISARKSKQLEMQDIYQRLGRSYKELEDFAYTASHDLQAPLRKIQSFANLLAANISAGLDAKDQDYLHRIREAANSMESLLNDLLSYSKATHSGDRFVATDPGAVIRRVLEATNAPERAQVELIIPDHLPSVPVVPVQIYQLFQNLIENAIKFAKPGEMASLKIQFECRAGSQLSACDLKPNEVYLVMTFADKGIGFDMVNANRIFNIFQRLHGKSEFPGSGVGLAICKKIVDNHSGCIFALGEAQLGASFTVALPLRR